MTTSMINVKGKPKLNFGTQLPKEMMQGFKKLAETESLSKLYLFKFTL